MGLNRAAWANDYNKNATEATTKAGVLLRRTGLLKFRLKASGNALPLAAVSLRAATLFFALLTLGNEVHLLTKCFGDPLRDDALVEAPDQLLDGLTFAPVYMHSDGDRFSKLLYAACRPLLTHPL